MYREVRGIDTFLHAHVDGIIASIAKETTHYEHYSEIKKRNIPLILFDRVEDSLQAHAVKIDDYKGGFIATEHLIQKGYKHIAHIAGLQHIQIFNDRLRGYKDALKKYRLAYKTSMVYLGKNSIDSGRDGMKTLLQKNKNIDAVFCVEDFTALGAMEYLKTTSIHIPNDMGIIGFANESFGAYLTPSLSTIDQRTIQMGEACATLFLELSNKGKAFANKNKKIVLEPLLIERDSTKR